MEKLHHVINLIKAVKPTKKVIELEKNNIYVFDIALLLTKPEIKVAIEKLFKVEVDRINLAKIPTKFKKIGKFIGKISQKKRMYLKLKPGYRLISKVFN